MDKQPDNSQQFVAAFRNSAPYIHAFRGRRFVIAFSGEAVAAGGFTGLIHDIALLNSLGIQLVLVHGARPQIEQRLAERGAELRYVGGLRVTDDAALACVKEAAGTVRVEIEALLSMGLTNSPMAGARVRVASGNFVTARPLGVREGVDYLHTGEVRRIDVAGIEQRLDDNAIVLLSPLGYSPTGEVFNIAAEDVATAAAVQLQADKLIFLMEDSGPLDAQQQLIRQLKPQQAETLLGDANQGEAARRYLQGAVTACRHGVRRAHLVNHDLDGALLLELFTRDGIGTLITDEIYDETRTASIDDVGGILELIEPLEAQGLLVHRSRDYLEIEIDHFTVMERDGAVIGCAALYPYPESGLAELACLAIHGEYRNAGRGDALLDVLEDQARQQGLQKLFILTTQSAHWFQERGFEAAEPDDLPMEKQLLYNYQRNSKIFMKAL